MNQELKNIALKNSAQKNSAQKNIALKNSALKDKEINQTVETKLVVLPEIIEDPIANFINNHWKNLIIIAGAVIVFFYARSQFIETSNARLGEAAGFYSRSVETILALGQGKATDEQKKALPDLIRALSESQEPYASLSSTLSNMSKIVAGDLVAAESQIALALPALDEKKEKQLPRLAAETAKLAAARALLPNEAKRAQAEDALVALVHEGEFVSATALSVLTTVDSKRVQKDGLQAKLEARKPYVAGVLKN